MLIIGIFVFVLFEGIPFLSLHRVSPKTRIADSKVSLVTPEYENLPNDPVRGKLVVTSSSLNGTNIVICAITDGAVYEIENTLTLICDRSYKEMRIEAGRGEMSLYSGSYFVAIESREPFRVNIHTGKQALLVLE